VGDGSGGVELPGDDEISRLAESQTRLARDLARRNTELRRLLDALQAIKARYPDLAVLILSGFPETQYATTLLRFGASGYLNKECPPEDIVEAIRVVARGRRYISPAVAELLADTALGSGEDRPLHEQLSEREMQVFLRLAQGETIGAMAEAMFLSVKTVSTYRTRVMQKLKLSSNSDLTYYAVKNGLIQ